MYTENAFLRDKYGSSALEDAVRHGHVSVQVKSGLVQDQGISIDY